MTPKNREPPPSSAPAPAHDEAATRRAYEAPRIEEVEIVAGEAMLGFCKTAGAPGAFAVCGGGCSAGGS